MKHIFLVDDYPGRVRDLLLIILSKYKYVDIKVHLLMITLNEKKHTLAGHFDSIKRDLVRDVHYDAHKRIDDILGYKPISYDNEAKLYDSEIKDIMDKIKEEITKRAHGEPFSVGVDMLLTGQNGEYDRNRVRNSSAQKVLSHYICEQYLGQCSLYSCVPNEADENCEKWSQVLENPRKIKINFTSKYNLLDDQLSKLAEQLYNLCS